MWSWDETKKGWRCKICVCFGIEPFKSMDGMEVAQHINDDHEINDIMDYLCNYGNGVEEIKDDV